MSTTTSDVHRWNGGRGNARHQRRSSTGSGSGSAIKHSGSNDSSDDNNIVPPASPRRSSHKKPVRLTPLNVAGSRSASSHTANTLETLPSEYLYNPKTTEPVLYYLPRLLQAVELEQQQQTAGTAAANPSKNPVTLRELLRAAAGDVRLHRARVQAGLHQNHKLIRTYQLETDPEHIARQKRAEERVAQQEELRVEAEAILLSLTDGSRVAASKGLTQAERQQLQLVRWQRALELYVYTHHQQHNTSSSSSSSTLDWQSLFEKLLDGISEDQDISLVLQQASQMCQKLVTQLQQAVQDSALTVAAEESAYVIRLQAHSMFARLSLQQVAVIEEQFQSSGKAALQIGHQLEHAELKRRQCEAASVLIRRWWILENLAEQEVTSGAPIAVSEEIEGIIPPNAAHLDHLFTKAENSLEAAKALKQLRAVVRSRGNHVATTGGTNSGNNNNNAGSTAVGSMAKDETSQRRFTVTANLIQRVSDALEQRLLNSFSKVYSAGGSYDFSHKPRPGAIDWRELRSLAAALLLFDSGRNLHKRYVDMVVASRFPELFSREKKEDEMEDDNNVMADDALDTFEKKREYNVDATRTKLSTLFHKVSDVCTAEFELIAHVFGSEGSRTDLLDGSEEMPLVVARALLQRVVSDPRHGLQARINDLLSSIDRLGDFDAGAKKLDTFVVIHEKAAGLFTLLKDAADRMAPDDSLKDVLHSINYTAAMNAVESLKGFLTSQELALSNLHRQSYINLELRLLHHDCCSSLDQAGCTLVKGPSPRPDSSLAEKGILEEYRAPILPLHMESLEKTGLTGILAGPLKQSVLRKPLIHATDSLSRARLMFGTNKRGGESTSRVILSIYSQICSFYGEGFLYPIVETLRGMLPTSPPSQPPQLPFDEEQDAHDLGVPAAFWVALERVHSAAKSFDRELWAEGRVESERVWETLEECGDAASMSFARGERVHFYAELERRGESAILRALDALSTHVQWILVTGGESMLATGGKRIMGSLSGASGGPYAIPAGSSLDTPNSPAVKALAYCLRVQFVHVQAALTPQSLASFWTALSMRLYDILVARLLQHYYISTVGAVILSRDVEALRSVAMLAGSDHAHWDTLRELLTLYMTPPDAIKALLVGPEGESSRGLFSKAGRDRCVVFLSRRNDYRYKTTTGMKKSVWVAEMLEEANIIDPTDGAVNIGLFAAGRKF